MFVMNCEVISNMYTVRAHTPSVKSLTRYLQCKPLEQISASPGWWSNRSVLVGRFIVQVRERCWTDKRKPRTLFVAVVAATYS